MEAEGGREASSRHFFRQHTRWGSAETGGLTLHGGGAAVPYHQQRLWRLEAAREIPGPQLAAQPSAVMRSRRQGPEWVGRGGRKVLRIWVSGWWWLTEKSGPVDGLKA